MGKVIFQRFAAVHSVSQMNSEDFFRSFDPYMKIRKLTEFVWEWKMVDGFFGFVPLGLSGTFRYHNLSKAYFLSPKSLDTYYKPFHSLRTTELPVSKAANAATEAMKTARQYLRLVDLKRWAEVKEMKGAFFATGNRKQTCRQNDHRM